MTRESKINWLYAIGISLLIMAIASIPDSNPDNNLPTIKTSNNGK